MNLVVIKLAFSFLWWMRDWLVWLVRIYRKLPTWDRWPLFCNNPREGKSTLPSIIGKQEVERNIIGVLCIVRGGFVKPGSTCSELAGGNTGSMEQRKKGVQVCARGISHHMYFTAFSTVHLCDVWGHAGASLRGLVSPRCPGKACRLNMPRAWANESQASTSAGNIFSTSN